MRFEKTTLCGLTLSAGLAVAGSGQAAITLVDSAVFTAGDVTAGSRTITAADLGGLGEFNPNGVDKLVISIGGEADGNGAGTNTNLVTSVTYGGVAMELAVAGAGNGNRRSSIWYLDDVSVAGDFVITFKSGTGNQDGIGFGAYALNGTLNGVADTEALISSTVSITTTTAGEFVVAGFARNGFDNSNGTLTGVQPPLTELYYANLSGSSAASGYATLGAADDYDLTIMEITNNVGTVVAAAFQPVPEPSSLALLGMGALLVARRRRG